MNNEILNRDAEARLIALLEDTKMRQGDQEHEEFLLFAHDEINRRLHDYIEPDSMFYVQD